MNDGTNGPYPGMNCNPGRVYGFGVFAIRFLSASLLTLQLRKEFSLSIVLDKASSFFEDVPPTLSPEYLAEKPRWVWVLHLKINAVVYAGALSCLVFEVSVALRAVLAISCKYVDCTWLANRTFCIPINLLFRKEANHILNCLMAILRQLMSLKGCS
jgi:hypothetical protein